MFRKHHSICFLLIVMLLVTLAACGKGNDSTKPSDSNQPTEQSPTQGTDKSQENSNSKTDGGQSDDEMIVPAKLTGTLNLIEMDDRDPSILCGVRIIGNNVGTQDDINGNWKLLCMNSNQGKGDYYVRGSLHTTCSG